MTSNRYPTVLHRAAMLLSGLLLVSLSEAAATHVADAAEAVRPNLVAIVTDDQGQWGTRAYGNRDVHTPHMDRLAREGMLLTNAFVLTPVCSPSRATYLSGLYPTEHSITDFLDENEDFTRIGFHSLTWPAVLQQHGYTTALVGKWDLGLLPRFYPTRHGFDHFFGYLSDSPGNMNPEFRVASTDPAGGLFRSSLDGPRRRFKGALPDILTDNAIAFVRANRDHPFALLLHYRAPHTPYLPVPDVDLEPYNNADPELPTFPGVDTAKLRRDTIAHYASITSADRNIGRLLDYLDRAGLAEKTIVVFTSDNGYNLGRHGIDSKGNGSWMAGGVRGPQIPNMWDTSLRVPLVVRWPGVVKPGVRRDHVVSNLDMFRTVLGMLDVPPPADAEVHGADLSPLLRGEATEEPEAIFGQYDLHNTALAYLRMVRTRRWKYVRHFHANFMDELYDLKNDPGETRNLMTRKGPRRDAISEQQFAHLQQLLLEWMKSLDDPLLDDDY